MGQHGQAIGGRYGVAKELVGTTRNEVVERRLPEYTAFASTRRIAPSGKTYSSDPSRQRSDCGTSSRKAGGGGTRDNFGLAIVSSADGFAERRAVFAKGMVRNLREALRLFR